MSKSSLILIVEDQEHWQKTLECLLTRAGYRVEVESTYSKALVKLKSASTWTSKPGVELCIVDIRLRNSDVQENWDGLGLLDVCRNEGIPVIVVTGQQLTPELESNKAKYNEIGWFRKVPFPLDEFLALVADRLESSIKKPLDSYTPSALPFPLSETITKTLQDRLEQGFERIDTRLQQRVTIDRRSGGFRQPNPADVQAAKAELEILFQHHDASKKRLTECRTREEFDKVTIQVLVESLTWGGLVMPSSS